MSGHVQDALEREFAGEPLEAEAASHLESCAECRAYRAKLQHVDSALVGGGLGPARREALEQKLFARLGVAPVAVAAPPRRWGALVGALAAVALVVVVGWLARPGDDAFTPRGGGEQVFGVRAFCVEGGRVVGEAVGGSLACGAGQAVQVTYTAPTRGRLRLVLDGVDEVFPAGADGGVAAGVDVPLGFSTPVGEWLVRPRTLEAEFVDERGGRSRSAVQLMPR